MKMFRFLVCIVLIGITSVVAVAQSRTDIAVQVDAQTGNYTVRSPGLNWVLGGSVGKPVTHLTRTKGMDSVGAYTSLSFQWETNNVYVGTIRWYQTSPVVLFSVATPKGANGQPLIPFPDFTTIPASLYPFSYHNRIFPLPQFFLEETSTPWLFFNDKKDALVISPASDFMVSLMTGDGVTHIASGLNPEVVKLPKNFTHTTILVMKQGIRNTWDAWGNTLRTMYARKRPANDADVLLKYFGIWTDVGGDYYYNYDPTKGYAGTLLALRDHYKKEGIPLGYMQLDSWWYQKSFNNVHNKPGITKKPEFPEGPWNRSGGVMEYKADTFLFPKGLAAFRKELGLPLITHNRWIDSASPYHAKYRISGISAIDPGFWKEIMGYLKRSGVAVYEQDWINYIYMNNPEMIADISIGNAFTDGMAKAALDNGIHMQYCMGLPRYFMQGVKYNNLTTIRTAGDRFKPERWMNFLFTSQLAYEMGIWPWSDVFKSSEIGNMTVSVLSAGPVGTGDAIGTEDKTNIFKACRQDGVIVKPDMPLLPLDQNYLQLAKKEGTPVVAYTYTKHRDITTCYVVAFVGDSTKTKNYSFVPADMDMKGKIVLYDRQHGNIQAMDAGDSYQGTLDSQDYASFLLAPVTGSGIAFLGDRGKIAATGKKRIASIESKGKALQCKVVFAKGERSVVLEMYSEKEIFSNKGKIEPTAIPNVFSLVVKAPAKGNTTAVTVTAR